VAHSLDGRSLILVGKSTSNMTRKEATDFIDFLLATAHDLGINLATDTLTGCKEIEDAEDDH
ncbi:MAG: hypothetical protein ACK4XK_14190, partial [Casimicrobiaceae bacterium]